MGKTTGFGKLERGMLSNNALPGDVRVAIIELKNALKSGQKVKQFDNEEEGLPDAAVGQSYVEFDVGAAHEGDRGSPRGRRRLVALIDPSRSIVQLYFSDTHYQVGEWKQLQYP